jgi:hypothetical protein
MTPAQHLLFSDLHRRIESAGLPVASISFSTKGDAPAITPQFTEAATDAEKAAIQSMIDAFDVSQLL